MFAKPHRRLPPPWQTTRVRRAILIRPQDRFGAIRGEPPGLPRSPDSRDRIRSDPATGDAAAGAGHRARSPAPFSPIFGPIRATSPPKPFYAVGETAQTNRSNRINPHLRHDRYLNHDDNPRRPSGTGRSSRTGPARLRYSHESSGVRDPTRLDDAPASGGPSMSRANRARRSLRRCIARATLASMAIGAERGATIRLRTRILPPLGRPGRLRGRLREVARPALRRSTCSPSSPPPSRDSPTPTTSIARRRRRMTRRRRRSAPPRSSPITSCSCPRRGRDTWIAQPRAQV